MRTRARQMIGGSSIAAGLGALALLVLALLAPAPTSQAARASSWEQTHAQVFPVDAGMRLHSAAGPTVTITVTVTPPTTSTRAAPPSGAMPMAIDVVPGTQSLVTATTNVNVRTGPGVAYPVLGYLPIGQVVTATGISSDTTWLQIVFLIAPDASGWVSRRYMAGGDLTNVPVVPAPPLRLSPTPTSTPIPTVTPIPTALPAPAAIIGWRGEYFENMLLQGPPRLVRDDPAVDFNWGGLSPDVSIPNDDFSARWTRVVTFDDSTYHFTVDADDGLRVWIDGDLIFDEWHDSRHTTYAKDVHLSAGPHTVQVEYYEHLGSAMIRLSWRKPDAWKVKYYNNRKVEDKAVLERYDDEINFDWGQGSPDPLVSADNFSARWTRDADFDEGTYVFTVDVDDGARVWVDDQLLVDSWVDGSRTLWAEKHFDDDGEHDVRVEYYEHYGNARIMLRWWGQ